MCKNVDMPGENHDSLSIYFFYWLGIFSGSFDFNEWNTYLAFHCCLSLRFIWLLILSDSSSWRLLSGLLFAMENVGIVSCVFNKANILQYIVTDVPETLVPATEQKLDSVRDQTSLTTELMILYATESKLMWLWLIKITCQSFEIYINQ